MRSIVEFVVSRRGRARKSIARVWCGGRGEHFIEHELAKRLIALKHFPEASK